MSTDTQWIEWIEECVKEKHVKYYKYKEFNKVEELGGGLVGKLYKANWKQDETCVALKSLNLPQICSKVLGGTFADQKICKDCPHR